LGRSLASLPDIVIITGGLKYRKQRSDELAADWSVIKGVLSYFESKKIDVTSRIETLLPDEKEDWDELVRFSAGNTIRLNYATLQARRFRLVSTADVIVTIQGSKATGEILDLALQLPKPILPLPFSGGVSEYKWRIHRVRIQEWFMITNQEAAYLESVKLQGLNTNSLVDLSETIKGFLGRRFTKRFQSVFISYGGPDELFAERLNDSLVECGVNTFLFSKDARPGDKLHRVMREGVNKHDRVVLICSRNSLERPGVVNELEETLQREARQGGAAVLIPITLDDYVFGDWAPQNPDLAQAVRDRVVADFRGTLENEVLFKEKVDCLISALKR
jgi:hypothetical protein